MFKQRLIATLALALLCTGAAHGSPFADFVDGYVQGTGADAYPDWISGDPYTNPDVALGRPTVDTYGWTPAMGDPAPVNPVNAAWRAYEVVSIGGGGSLTVGFDEPVYNDPLNPYGLDFIVFGNSFVTLLEDAAGNSQYWNTDDDPNDLFLTTSFGAEPAVVSVSQDGINWYDFSQPFADDWAPTLGRVYDPSNPDTSLGSWNEWWGDPTDPTVPLDPLVDLASIDGLSIAELCLAYGDSAGGTAFDLDWLGVVGLDWVQYIQVSVADGSGLTADIDAFADVAPLGGSAPIPEPATCALFLAACAGAALRRRCT